MTPRRGHVWFETRRVGALRADEHGRLRFGYDPQWLEHGFPVSITLPLSAGAAEVDAHPFFEGLLPEGGARRRLARQHRLDEHDDAGLLFAIGEDCAGALAILPDGEMPTEATHPPVPLSEQDLSMIVQSHGEALPLRAAAHPSAKAALSPMTSSALRPSISASIRCCSSSSRISVTTWGDNPISSQ